MGEMDRMYLYDNGSMNIITPSSGFLFLFATGINDSGMITGYGLTGSSVPHGFKYQGGITDLNNLVGSPWTIMATLCSNTSGTIGGFGYKNTSEPYIITINGSTVTEVYEGDGMVYCINELGDIAGDAKIYGGTHAFVKKNGSFTLIDWDTDKTSYAFGINDSCQVVGKIQNLAATYSYAFIWEDEQTINLNQQIPDGSGWSLEEAWDINNNGQIVGGGTINGEQHAFMLTPTVKSVPTISEWGMMVTAIIILLTGLVAIKTKKTFFL